MTTKKSNLLEAIDNRIEQLTIESEGLDNLNPSDVRKEWLIRNLVIELNEVRKLIIADRERIVKELNEERQKWLGMMNEIDPKTPPNTDKLNHACLLGGYRMAGIARSIVTGEPDEYELIRRAIVTGKEQGDKQE